MEWEVGDGLAGEWSFLSFHLDTLRASAGMSHVGIYNEHV